MGSRVAALGSSSPPLCHCAAQKRVEISKWAIMKSYSSAFVLAFCCLLSATTAEKKVVTYLGTDFILPGGCPPPALCNPDLRDSVRNTLRCKRNLILACWKRPRNKAVLLTDYPTANSSPFPSWPTFAPSIALSTTDWPVSTNAPTKVSYTPRLIPN